ncbi:hypothetical protein NESM_000665100 [Novymonas esmeraldas]|uniref:C2 domain-containing protein n=1 Tax=Novymonas esmeraldas TaxID=1808958 RepID=A0AAW0EUJ0_9TRYP
MPVVDVSVLCATELSGVSLRKSFCVYVRLQGQAIRTKPADPDRLGEVRFGERFRFQYQRDTVRPGRNRMFVELWTKSLFSQGCVSVAWLEMDEQRFVRGQQLRVNVRGTFEGKHATVSLVITPLDFGENPNAPQQPQQQQLFQQQQQQYPYPQPQQQQPYPPQQQVLYGLPAEGVPLAPPNPYSSAAYTPNACAVAQDPTSCCPSDEVPQPQAFVGASLPPPLYPGMSRNQQSGGGAGQYPEALPPPGGNPEYDYGFSNDYPQKPKQL